MIDVEDDFVGRTEGRRICHRLVAGKGHHDCAKRPAKTETATDASDAPTIGVPCIGRV
jgi:hypothetical protein